MARIPKYFYIRVHAKRTSIELEDASDVDVVEVVRCKDCQDYRRYDDERFCCTWGDTVEDDDYCSYGVRRDGKQNEQ